MGDERRQPGRLPYNSEATRRSEALTLSVQISSSGEYRARAVEDVGGHDCAVLGEGIGQMPDGMSRWMFAVAATAVDV
jgi:hypothetical protein